MTDELQIIDVLRELASLAAGGAVDHDLSTLLDWYNAEARRCGRAEIAQDICRAIVWAVLRAIPGARQSSDYRRDLDVVNCHLSEVRIGSVSVTAARQALTSLLEAAAHRLLNSEAQTGEQRGSGV